MILKTFTLRGELAPGNLTALFATWGASLRWLGQQVLARPAIVNDVIGEPVLKALLLPTVDAHFNRHRSAGSEAKMEGGVRDWTRPDPLACRNDARRQQGDPEASCHEQIEASYADQLLFPREQFADDVRSLPPSIESAKRPRDRYQNTTPVRLLERSADIRTSPRNSLRYFIRSRWKRTHVRSLDVLQSIRALTLGFYARPLARCVE